MQFLRRVCNCQQSSSSCQGNYTYYLLSTFSKEFSLISRFWEVPSVILSLTIIYSIHIQLNGFISRNSSLSMTDCTPKPFLFIEKDQSIFPSKLIPASVCKRWNYQNKY